MDLPHAEGLGRYTAQAIGEEAIQYANDWIAECGKWYEKEDGLGHWILEWADKIGKENIVFVRVSDEDDRAEYGTETAVRELAKSEMEYH